MTYYAVWTCNNPKCQHEHRSREEAVECCPPVQHFICGTCGMFFEEQAMAETCHSDSLALVETAL